MYYRNNHLKGKYTFFFVELEYYCSCTTKYTLLVVIDFACPKGDVGCLPFTQNFRKLRLECRWNAHRFGSSRWKFSGMKTNENASLTAILLNSQSDLHPKFECRTCSLTRFVSGLRFIFSLSLFIFFASPRRPDRRLLRRRQSNP